MFAACGAACICSKQLEGAWPMALQQINLRIEQELLKQMKAEAKQRGLSLNLLAASAFEQFLAGGGAAEQSAPKQAELAEILQRLEVLERKLAKQEQQAHHLPHGPAPAAVKPPAEAKPAPVVQADGLLTPAELELLTGTKRGTWNAWASSERIGQARSDGGRQFELVGKVPPPKGGNARWVYRQL